MYKITESGKKYLRERSDNEDLNVARNFLILNDIKRASSDIFSDYIADDYTLFLIFSGSSHKFFVKFGRESEDHRNEISLNVSFDDFKNILNELSNSGLIIRLTEDESVRKMNGLIEILN